MQISRKFFPPVMQENDITYFLYVIATVESVDELCTMEITRMPNSYHFRIAPSMPEYREMLLEEVLKIHNVFRIRLNMSKSIKTSAAITFDVELK